MFFARYRIFSFNLVYGKISSCSIIGNQDVLWNEDYERIRIKYVE